MAIAVKDGEVLSFATNAHDCKRIGMATGKGYELCEGCDYSNHAEYKATKGKDLKDATLYLFGHYYACKSCEEATKESGAHLKLK